MFSYAYTPNTDKNSFYLIKVAKSEDLRLQKKNDTIQIKKSDPEEKRVDIKKKQQSLDIKKSNPSIILDHSKKKQTAIDSVPKPDLKQKKVLDDNLSFKGEYYIGRAWEYFEKNDYEKAIDIFIFVEKFPELDMERKYGLALCYYKQNNNEKALPLLKWLLNQAYNSEEIIPILIPLLVSEKDYTTARQYLIDMSDFNEKEKWQNIIDDAIVNQDFKDAIDSKNADLLIEFVDSHKNELEKCEKAELFLKAAEELAKNNYKEEAISIYNNLLTYCLEKEDMRIGIFYKLKPIIPASEMILLVDREMGQNVLHDDYKKKLKQLKLDLLNEKIASLSPSSEEINTMAEEMLAIDPDNLSTLYTLAWLNYRNEKYSHASELFLRLNKRDSDNKEYLEGLLLSYAKQNRFDEVLAILNEYEPLSNDLLKIKRDVFAEIANKHYENEEYVEAEKYLRGLLEMDSENVSANYLLAWLNYRNEKYSHASELFLRLNKRDSDNKEYLEGLLLSYVKQNRFDEVLTVLNEYEPLSNDLLKIKGDVLAEIANKHYENKEYVKAEKYLRGLLEMDSENVSVNNLLAWSLYKQEKYDEALIVFLSIYEKQRTNNIAEIVIDLYDKIERQQDVVNFAKRLSNSDDNQLNKVASDYYFSRNWPIKASQTYNGAETPYYNEKSPRVDIFPYFRLKSGNKGTSRLSEEVYPVSFDFPFNSGNNLRFTFNIEKLSASESREKPFVGKAYRGVLLQDHITSGWVGSPMIEFEKEGTTKFLFQIGSTPWGSEVFPMPTFVAQIENERWRAGIHQRPVKESILSYAGIQDPYGSAEWGRIVKSGISGGYTFTPLPSYWISLDAGFDYYWGKDSWENFSLNGNIAFGKTITTGYGNLSLGNYIAIEHFDRNSDFFTFGHGGYFSPEFFMTAGPFARISIDKSPTYWLDAQLSAGFMSYQAGGAPIYPLDSDQGGRFDQVNHSGLSYSVQIQGQKLLTSHFAIGGFFGMNKSANFADYTIGIRLTCFLRPRNKIFPRLFDFASANK